MVMRMVEPARKCPLRFLTPGPDRALTLLEVSDGGARHYVTRASISRITANPTAVAKSMKETEEMDISVVSIYQGGEPIADVRLSAKELQALVLWYAEGSLPIKEFGPMRGVL